MSKKNVIEEIQDEAREGYSLFERLSNRNVRTKTVTVYTDETLGAELGYAFDEELPGGIKTGKRTRKGLIGDLDALSERTREVLENGTAEDAESVVAEIEAEQKALKAKVAKVRKAMQKDAFVFTLRSVPKLVKKDARRKTRKALDIKGKGIPEARQEDYDDEYTYQMLSASVVTWEDKKVGKTFSTLSVEEARQLDGMLPEGQFPLLNAAMVELSYEQVIANQSVDDADF